MSSWNTIARSSPGPATGAPSTVSAPALGRDQARQRADKRRLAAARASDDADELAFGNDEIDALQRQNASPVGRPELDPEVAEFDLRRGRHRRPPVALAEVGPAQRPRP